MFECPNWLTSLWKLAIIKFKFSKSHLVLSHMRFLKTKIQLASEALERRSKGTSSPSIHESLSQASTDDSQIQVVLQDLPKRRAKMNVITPPKPVCSKLNPLKGDLRATKNIVVNYGKAITSFALSKLATPYLKTLLEGSNITRAEFNQFAKKAREQIAGIDSFRSLLMIDEKKEGLHVANCKRILIQVAEIFIKYFSVNWIIHGRLLHKLTYLKYRFKVLRRIHNPELFTYMSNEKKRDASSLL